jgi:ribosomal protein S20
VPRIKSAKKRVETTERNRLRNIAYRSAVKTAIKRVVQAVASKLASPEVISLHRKADSLIDRVTLKGIFHRNKAARLKSRLAKKVAAGAQFIQTQYCYDIPRLRTYMQQVEDLGLLGKVFILVGVGPMRSAKVAEWMRSNVPGVHIPDAVIKRMAGAEKPAAEGRKICTEIMQEVKDIKGVAGVHIMAYRQEDAVPEMVQNSGVLQGRVPWFPGRDGADAELRYTPAPSEMLAPQSA